MTEPTTDLVDDPTDADQASIQHLLQLDQWHRDLGHVMCAGVCSRWYEPDALDEFGSCRALDCQRAAVNP